MKKNRTEIIEYINTLKGYAGYVQFSHRAIDIEKDVFEANDPQVEEEGGFIYEGHFSNGSESIAIRQLNDVWLVSKVGIAGLEVETFHGIADLKINMVQVWESKTDELCEGMEVSRLEKVVFAGFAKGEAS